MSELYRIYFLGIQNNLSREHGMSSNFWGLLEIFGHTGQKFDTLFALLIKGLFNKEYIVIFSLGVAA